MAEFAPAFSVVIANEGGLVELANDPGGITNFGISLRFLKTIQADATADTIRNLSIDQAKNIYLIHFWLSARFKDITSQLIACFVFDMVVNMGLGNAVKCVQRATNVQEDGVMGKDTLCILNSSDESALLRELRKYRCLYYCDLVLKNPLRWSELNGWINRSNKKFG